jgi:hypothetical protein
LAEFHWVRFELSLLVRLEIVPLLFFDGSAKSVVLLHQDVVLSRQSLVGISTTTTASMETLAVGMETLFPFSEGGHFLAWLLLRLMIRFVTSPTLVQEGIVDCGAQFLSKNGG